MLKCDSWKKCYSGYEQEKHYFYHVETRRACVPDNCINFHDGSRLIDYDNYTFGVSIKNISRAQSGLWRCRMQDSETGRWSDLRTFNVVIE